MVESLAPCLPLDSVREAAEHFEILVRQLAQAYRDVRALEDARSDAVAADNDAYATAIRAGERDPGPKHTNAADKKLTDARRRRDALHIAASQAAHEFNQLLDAHREELVGVSKDRLAQAEGEFLKEIDRFDFVADGVREARAQLRFVSRWPEPGARYFEDHQYLHGVLRRNDQPYTVSDLLEEFRTAVTSE